jgi:S-formylglutathione hydrolase FrmB
MSVVPPATPSPPPTPAQPTPIPQLLNPPDLHQFNHGVSLLGGWLPVTVEVITVIALIVVIGRWTRRWLLLWIPVCVALGVVGALVARALINDEGLASDPAPFELWIWVAVSTASIAVAVLGWRSAHWWRRALSVLVIPLALVATLMELNRWVGYYPSVQAAWGALTAGPLPDQTDAAALPGLRNTSPTTGKLVEVTIPDTASGFKHRNEYVYLPPAWFAGPPTSPPPALPVVMMVAGEFNTPADWMRSGNVMPVIDGYAHDNGGVAPIFVFVDSGGRFNNDTECVDGPRGNSADHLTKDVRPYVISQFGASAQPADWGVVGWSMGGTCAVDLTVMHPDLFTAFEDIAGDHGPTAGTKEQTVDRLFGGNAAQWAAFDPATVMRNHGPYTGVSGWFEDTAKPATAQSNTLAHSNRPQPNTPLGFGGHDDWRDTDETGAAEDLCGVATSVAISCSVHTLLSYHTWQFAAHAFGDALPWLADQIHTPQTSSAQR